MSNLKTKYLQYGLCSLLLLTATPSFSNQWLTCLAPQIRHKLPTWLGGAAATTAPQLCLPATAGPDRSTANQPRKSLPASRPPYMSVPYLHSLCQIAGTEQYFSKIEATEFHQEAAKAVALDQDVEKIEQDRREDRPLIRGNWILEQNLKRTIAATAPQPPIALPRHTYDVYCTQVEELVQLQHTRELLADRIASEEDKLQIARYLALAETYQRELAHLQAISAKHPALISILTPEMARTEAKLSACRDRIQSNRKKIQDLQQSIAALDAYELKEVQQLRNELGPDDVQIEQEQPLRYRFGNHTHFEDIRRGGIWNYLRKHRDEIESWTDKR